MGSKSSANKGTEFCKKKSTGIQNGDLKRQVSMMKQQRAELEMELESSKEMHTELRETIDVLRGKLHGLGQREVCPPVIDILV